MPATRGKPETSKAFPLEPRVQGRFASIGMAGMYSIPHNSGMSTHAIQLRKQMRDARKALSAPARLQAAQGLAEQLLTLPFAPQSGYVAGYWAVDGEIPLHAWQLQLPHTCIWCLPVLDEATDTLKFAPWRPGDATTQNKFGIPEPTFESSALLPPEAMTLIALPLTAFDRSAHRIGMGGGWYDRTLAQVGASARPRYVGVGYELQCVESITPQTWDIRCDAICTDTHTYFS